MQLLAVVLLAAALGVVGLAISRAARVFSGTLEDLRAELGRIADGPEAQFSLRLRELEDLVERLPQRWEEFKNAAVRAEGRARSIVADARKELEGLGLEHPALEEQGRELRLVDAEERGSEPVPPVHQNVESAEPAPQGWRTAALRRKFGG